MSEMTIVEFCDLHNACIEGRNWATSTGSATMEELWQREDLRHEWREWIASRPGVLTDRELRLYACWCVRRVWHLLKDERSRTAVEVAERYADGLATNAELAAARAAARDAARASEGAAWAARASEGAAWAAWAAGVAAWAAAGVSAGVSAGAAAGVSARAAGSEAWATGAAQSKWLRENTHPQFRQAS